MFKVAAAALATVVAGPGIQDPVDAAGLEEELRAILKIIVERHLRDDRIDPYLQRKYIDLAQHRFHRGQLTFGSVDQDGIVLIIRYHA